MNHKRGLTLIEVLVVVTILSVLALSIYTVFKSGIDAWSRSEARLEIYQSGRVVLDQLSREVVGAFVGGGAVLMGTPGATPADPDTLEFVTNFSGSIYKIRYRVVVDTVYTSKQALERAYINYIGDDPVDVGKDYTSAYDSSHTIIFVPATKEVEISNMQFQYLPVMPSPLGKLPAALSPRGMIDWSDVSKVDAWPRIGANPPDGLPEAVKIILTLKDANGKDYIFETIVYLPNSEE